MRTWYWMFGWDWKIGTGLVGEDRKRRSWGRDQILIETEERVLS